MFREIAKQNEMIDQIKEQLKVGQLQYSGCDSLESYMNRNDSTSQNLTYRSHSLKNDQDEGKGIAKGDRNSILDDCAQNGESLNTCRNEANHSQLSAMNRAYQQVSECKKKENGGDLKAVKSPAS